MVNETPLLKSIRDSLAVIDNWSSKESCLGVRVMSFWEVIAVRLSMDAINILSASKRTVVFQIRVIIRESR